MASAKLADVMESDDKTFIPEEFVRKLAQEYSDNPDGYSFDIDFETLANEVNGIIHTNDTADLVDIHWKAPILVKFLSLLRIIYKMSSCRRTRRRESEN